MSLIVTYEYANTNVELDGSVTGQGVIRIWDAVTNSPTNGNNVIVTYNEIVGGISTQKQVTVAGQTQLIYAGTLVPIDGSFPVSWSTVSVSDVPDPAPPVNQCDLFINSVVIQQPESSFNSNDASVKILASSSYGPILYSLDNVTFQLSNIFSGLSGGLKTVYVTDANTVGCAANKSFTVPVLSDLLVSDPSVTIGSNKYRWSAAFNPVNFIYQRKDFEITSVDSITIINAGTYARVYVNGDVTGLKVNDAVYIDAGSYKGVYKVLQLGTTAGSFVIDGAYSSTATGFANINRLRPYYKVLTKITYVDPLTGLFNEMISTNRPDNTGYVKADLSNFLQSILRAKDSSDYTTLNFRDDNLSASYQVQYTETWDGHTPTYINLPYTYYVLYAAKQLGDRYGGNLAEYVPAPVGSAAKWITDFNEPVYNNAFPFDISFIYSELVAGRELYYKLIQYDINRNPLSVSAISVALLNEDGSFLLNQDNTKLLIAKQDLFNTPIAEHVGLNRLLINTQFTDDVYFFSIALYYDEGSTPVKITTDQFVRIDKEIQLQSVYLRWIGLSGSWNYYRFYYNQQIGLDVNSAITIKNYVLNWETQDTMEDVISKSAGQKMKLATEDTSVADIKGLQSIKYSPKVQMLINSNPVKWQTVIVNTSTFDEYETLKGQAPFNITISLPSINVQSQ
jgi:hypothetical protein